MEENQVLVTADNIQNLVYTIRGQQVMLDSDLAEIYGYTTKRLNEQVARNIERFPEDFMFQINQEEVDILRSQFATANISTKSRTLPYVFTEQGVYMLTTVLKKELAVQQSIAIMRAFKEMRYYIQQNWQFVTQNEMNAISAHLSYLKGHVSSFEQRVDKEISNIKSGLQELKSNFVNEQVYQCGTSSKDAGSKVCSIIKIEKIDLYHPIMDKMLQQEDLVL